MSMLALDSNSNRIDGSGGGFNRGCISRPTMEERFPVNNLDSRTSSSSSSIGKNSDSSSERCEASNHGDGDEEVQSSYKGPLDSLNALEEVLPIRRGISKFYNGKSKSFTSLSEASSSKELAKPENSYSKKRKNLLATSIFLDKNRNNPVKSNVGGGLLNRRNSKRSMLSLAGAMCSSESTNTSENSNSSSSPPRLPPLHPQRKPHFNNASVPQEIFSPRRSFSLADLQFAMATTANNTTTAPSSHRGEQRDPD